MESISNKIVLVYWYFFYRCDRIQIKHDLSSLSESKAASAASYILKHSGNLNVAMGSTWVSGQFQELASTAYRDEFRSVSIPYAVIAAVYYGKCYYELKKSNEILRELNGNSGS